jgi:putative transposase
MVRQVGLHLISKLRYNSALYVPYEGPYSGRGPHRKYGQKLDYCNIPSEYLKSMSIDQEIKTQIYQMSLWHKKFSDLLNIVMIVKTSLKTNQTAHVVLFSSDLNLGYEPLIDY